MSDRERSEVRGSTHPRPGRRAERPGEGERSRTAPSEEEESDEETRRKRRRSQEAEGEEPRKLSRTQEVKETNTRVCRESEEDGRFRNATPENKPQTTHPKIERKRWICFVRFKHIFYKLNFL